MARTQWEQVQERAASAAAKATGRALAKAAGKALPRCLSPWLLAADLAHLGAETVAAGAGCDGKTAERVGQFTGFAGSVGTGAGFGSFGGPVGAAVGAGIGATVRVGGEIVGKFTGWLFSAKE
ncbi:MAG: hypothetical protein K2W96_21180 [Gemmataceae bacterium]|nr:hypothetical protein [Gemmataceae bacterium]